MKKGMHKYWVFGKVGKIGYKSKSKYICPKGKNFSKVKAKMKRQGYEYAGDTYRTPRKKRKYAKSGLFKRNSFGLGMSIGTVLALTGAGIAIYLVMKKKKSAQQYPQPIGPSAIIPPATMQHGPYGPQPLPIQSGQEMNM